nr:hypothetical protein [Tanacetum cinerariifolium]
LEEKQLEEERAAKAQNWKLPVCYDDDDYEERSDSLDDNIIFEHPPFSAITPNDTILSTEEPDQFEDFSEFNEEFSSTDDDSFSFDKINYVEASPLDSEHVSSEVMEIVIPKVGGIDADILLIIKDDILRENLLNVNRLFPKIEASNENPIIFYDPIISGTPPNLTPSGESDFFLKTKSFSTSLNSLLEETNNFDNSLPEFTTFSNVLFDAEYKSNSSNDQSCFDEDVLEKIISKPLFEEEIIPKKIDLHPDNAKSDLMKSLRTHDSSLPISSKIDSLLEEFADYPMPSGIVDEDYDSKRDILIRKDLPSNNTLSFAEKE